MKLRMKLGLISLLSVCALVFGSHERNIRAQDADKEVHPLAGKFFKKWPAKALGMTESERNLTLAKLLFDTDFSGFSKKKIKMRRGLVLSDIVPKPPKKALEKKAAEEAWRFICFELGAQNIKRVVDREFPHGEAQADYIETVKKGKRKIVPTIKTDENGEKYTVDEWVYEEAPPNAKFSDITHIWVEKMFWKQRSHFEIVSLEAAGEWKVEQFFGDEHENWVLQELVSPRSKKEALAFAWFISKHRCSGFPWWTRGRVDTYRIFHGNWQFSQALLNSLIPWQERSTLFAFVSSEKVEPEALEEYEGRVFDPFMKAAAVETDAKWKKWMKTRRVQFSKDRKTRKKRAKENKDNGMPIKTPLEECVKTFAEAKTAYKDQYSVALKNLKAKEKAKKKRRK